MPPGAAQAAVPATAPRRHVPDGHGTTGGGGGKPPTAATPGDGHGLGAGLRVGFDAGGFGMADEDEAPDETVEAAPAEDGAEAAAAENEAEAADDDLEIVKSEDDQAEVPTEAPAAAVSPAEAIDGDGPLEAVYDISVDVTAVLGTATMRVSQLLKMGRGAVVQLNRMVDEEVDLRCKGLLIARGEVVVVNENLGVNLTKIIKTNIAKM
jgi:flagellar motor switch protein FliN/FliY